MYYTSLSLSLSLSLPLPLPLSLPLSPSLSLSSIAQEKNQEDFKREDQKWSCNIFYFCSTQREKLLHWILITP